MTTTINIPPTMHKFVSTMQVKPQDSTEDLSNSLNLVLYGEKEPLVQDVFQALTQDVPLQGIQTTTTIHPESMPMPPVQSRIALPIESILALVERIKNSTHQLLTDKSKRDLLAMWEEQQLYHRYVAKHDATHFASLAPMNAFGEVHNYVQGIVLQVLNYNQQLEKEHLAPSIKEGMVLGYVEKLLTESFSSSTHGTEGATVPPAAKHTNGIYYVNRDFKDYAGDLSTVINQWLEILKDKPELVEKMNKTASTAQALILNNKQGLVAANYTPKETTTLMQLLQIVLTEHTKLTDRSLFPSLESLFSAFPKEFQPNGNPFDMVFGTMPTFKQTELLIRPKITKTLLNFFKVSRM